jgi:hypothetical protein
MAKQNQKKITAHLHSRIKTLADAAFDRSEITLCDRQPDDSYILTLSSDNIPTIYTAVGAGTLLYLLNALAIGTIKPEPKIKLEETET